ncbi:MAG: DUF452 family protein [Bacteroidales bacterium]|nr:DUF452 family protein [Bacteroidales bacterium]
MKTFIKRREKNTELVVVYAGWGIDENMFVPLSSDDTDLILFYDYSADEALVLPEIKTYTRVTVIGWSLGVWAAEHLSGKTGIAPDLKIAVNGTPLPADDRYGIPLKIIEGTLEKLDAVNVKKYYYRIFGDKKSFEENRERIPKRTTKSLQDELRWLYNRMMEQSDPAFKWDYAVISEKDRVFPASSQINYWKTRDETKILMLPMNHYILNKWSDYRSFIDYVCKHGKSRRKRTVTPGL